MTGRQIHHSIMVAFNNWVVGCLEYYPWGDGGGDLLLLGTVVLATLKAHKNLIFHIREYYFITI